MITTIPNFDQNEQIKYQSISYVPPNGTVGLSTDQIKNIGFDQRRRLYENALILPFGMIRFIRLPWSKFRWHGFGNVKVFNVKVSEADDSLEILPGN